MGGGGVEVNLPDPKPLSKKYCMKKNKGAGFGFHAPKKNQQDKVFLIFLTLI